MWCGRGFESHISPALEASLKDVNCVYCGQCINACPVAALTEKDETKAVWRKLKDKDWTVIVQTAPAVRVRFR